MSRKPTAQSSAPSTAIAESAPLKFHRVATRRIFEDICDQIRAELAAGSLRPGDRLPAERELAERFGVSRLAVREALRSLEVTGVVALRKGVKGGAFVQEGSPEQLTQSLRDLFYLGHISMSDLSEARGVIMRTIVPLACQRASESDYRALAANISRIATLGANAAHEERFALSTEFYRLIAACTGNNVLRMIVDLVTDIVLREVTLINPEPLSSLLKTRRKFLERFRAGDAQGATELMTTHLKRLERHLAQFKRDPLEARAAPTGRKPGSGKRGGKAK